MKAYQKNGYEFFYDRNIRQWILYPVDKDGLRVEWDKNDNPIESLYFNNKTEVENWFKSCINQN